MRLSRHGWRPNRNSHSSPARRPDDALAVRDAQRRGFEHAGELRIGSRAHHELWVDRGDEMMAAFLDKRLDAPERRLHVDAVHADSEYPGLGLWAQETVPTSVVAMTDRAFECARLP